MKRIVLAWILIAAGMLATAGAARAPRVDLDSCHDDLDSLRRAADDASTAADDAESKRKELEDCSEDSELHGGCRDYKSEADSALGDLESKMDDVDGRLWSVQASCEYDFTMNRMSSLEASQRRLQRSQRRLCESIRKIESLGMPPEGALQMCKSNMAEQWCKACLGLK